MATEFEGEDYLPGNPEHHVLGKPEEKPVVKRKPTPARRITEATILADIRVRMQTIEPAVNEYEQLSKAFSALEKIG